MTILLLGGEVLAHVQLDYPTGGETFAAGEVISIHWHVLIPHNQENWDLYFSPNGGGSWEVIQLNIDNAQLSYQWTVPETATDNAVIRIVQDNRNADYDDYSDAFTILFTPTSAEETGVKPEIFMLHNNYPNPFNPSTVINYQIPSSGFVELNVYDILGHKVSGLVNKQQSAGNYKVTFEAKSSGRLLRSGIYIYQITVSNSKGYFRDSKKMTLIR
jgi:hypothetical protein